MLRQMASLLRSAALRSRCLSLAKTLSIGVTSGGEDDQPCACGPDGIAYGGALVAAKVVEDHDAPLRSMGASTASPHVRKMWPLIGPTITKAAVIAGWRRAAITQSGGDRGLAKGVDHPKAVIAAWRRAAVKVMVFRYPKGAFPIRRLPRTAHRRSGVMLGLTVRHWARTGGALNGSLSLMKTILRMLTPPGMRLPPQALADHVRPVPLTGERGFFLKLSPSACAKVHILWQSTHCPPSTSSPPGRAD